MRLPRAPLPAIIVFLQATAVWAEAPPAVEFPPFDAAACVAKPELFQSRVTELVTPRVGDGSQVEVFSRARIGDGSTPG